MLLRRVGCAPVSANVRAHKNMRLLLSIILLVVAATANATPQKCAVSGEPLQWAADYCLYSAATDDFAHPKVAACIQKQKEPLPRKACAVKIKYKKSMCEIVVKNQSYQGSLTECVHDKDFSGPTVRNNEL